MPQLKAIIFDIDGVLVDSINANIEFFRRLLVKAGYPRPSRSAVTACFHLPMWQTIEQLTDTRAQSEIGRIFELGHDKSLYPRHLLVLPGSLHTVLSTLHHRYRLAIVTSRVRIGVETVYEHTGIEPYFEFAVSFEHYEHPKPHPQSLQFALKKLALQPHQAVYVGDSHTDIEAAKSAGMPSIHLAAAKHRDATVGITKFDQIPDAVGQIERAAG